MPRGDAPDIARKISLFTLRAFQFRRLFRNPGEPADAGAAIKLFIHKPHRVRRKAFIPKSDRVVARAKQLRAMRIGFRCLKKRNHILYKARVKTRAETIDHGNAAFFQHREEFRIESEHLLAARGFRLQRKRECETAGD